MKAGGRVYRYELHCHTAEGSLCSDIPLREIAGFYKELGYSGICITDHFTGNGATPDDMPWRERIDFFYDIHDKARKAGLKAGIAVFSGIEYSIAPDINHLSRSIGTDFLFIDIKKEWLKENQDAFGGKTSELLTRVRKSGAFVIQAHPFSERSWIECIRLFPRVTDAVEVINTALTDFENGSADAYADTYNLYKAAGSDCHSMAKPLFSGMEVKKACLAAQDLIKAIKTGEAKPFVTPNTVWQA